jgi:hypothetical protein
VTDDETIALRVTVIGGSSKKTPQLAGELGL